MQDFGQRHEAQDPTDYAHRHFVNLASAVFLLFIAIAIVWTIKAMEEHEKLQRCVSAGKRDCIEINIPPRTAIRALTR